MNIDLTEYMVKSMLSHAKQHDLAVKISTKWEISTEEIEENMQDLAKYVVEGIMEIVH